MAAMLSAIACLVFAARGAETIITTGGSVLTGLIESGLSATVSVTSNTDDVFTVQRVNMKHVRFGDHREVTVETLLDATRLEETPVLLPYAQLGTDAFVIPDIGGGLLFRLGKIAYFDLGATLDTIGVPWLSIGILIFF